MNEAASMRRFVSAALLFAFVAMYCATIGQLEAQVPEDRLRFGNTDLAMGGGEQSIHVIGDLRQPILAFSVAVSFDVAALEVVDVVAGSDLAELEPEFLGGRIDVIAGELSYGVVLTTETAGGIDRTIPAGSDIDLLELSVRVLETTPGQTTLQFIDRAATADSPPLRNLFTDVNGQNVEPSPSKVDAAFSIVDLAPRIDEVLDNSGFAGSPFFVEGAHLDQPGLEVLVCERVAVTQVMSPTRLRVMAPSCGSAGWAPVRVSTDYGSDETAQGFFYEMTPEGQFIRGDSNDDATVDLSDGVAIFSDLFIGVAAPAPCRDALDANDDGSADISDGIYVLNFLFQGGPPIPEPWPLPGADPTPDSLPSC